MGELLPSAEKKPDLCKAAHEVSQSLRVWTLQLLDDLETLVQLGKHVHHRTGKESVLWRLLELSPGRKEKNRKVRKKKKSIAPLNKPSCSDLHPKGTESCS